MDSTSGSIDVNVIGVVLMVVGLIVFALSIVLWRSWWGVGFWGGFYDDGGGAPVVRRRYYRPYTRRRTEYVEEDPPPPGP